MKKIKELSYFLSLVILMISLIIGCRNPQGHVVEIEVEDINGDGLLSMDEIIGASQTPNPNNVFIQPVTIITNPVQTELLPCAITEGKPDNDPWVFVTQESLKSINAFKSDDSGNMWVATEGHGLVMFDGVEWRHWESTEDIPFSVIKGLGVDSQVVIAGIAYAPVTAESGNQNLPHKSSILLYDQASNLWNEILKFESGEVKPNDDLFPGLTVTEDGRIFLPLTTIETTKEGRTTSVSYSSKLAIFEGGSWNYVDIPIGITGITDGEMDSQGNYWIATQNAGVLKYDGTGWTGFSASQGYVPLNSVKGIAITKNDIVWAVTTTGLGAILPDGTGKILMREDYPFGANPLEDIAIDKQNRLWILSNERVTVYNGSKWAILKDGSESSPRDWSYNIAVDNDGCTWIAESGSFTVHVFRGTLDLDDGTYFELQ